MYFCKSFSWLSVKNTNVKSKSVLDVGQSRGGGSNGFPRGTERVGSDRKILDEIVHGGPFLSAVGLLGVEVPIGAIPLALHMLQYFLKKYVEIKMIENLKRKK